LVDQFGEPELDKDKKPTGRTQVPPAKHKEFNDTFTKYLEAPTNIVIDKIPYELMEQSGVKVSSADILALEKFLAEPVAPLPVPVR